MGKGPGIEDDPTDFTSITECISRFTLIATYYTLKQMITNDDLAIGDSSAWPCSQVKFWFSRVDAIFGQRRTQVVHGQSGPRLVL